MSCSKHRGTNFVRWNQFDHLVVVGADSLIHWNAEWRAAVSYAIDQFASVLALGSATRLGCCTATTPTAFGHRWQARMEGVGLIARPMDARFSTWNSYWASCWTSIFQWHMLILVTMLRGSAEFPERSEVDTLNILCCRRVLLGQRPGKPRKAD